MFSDIALVALFSWWGWVYLSCLFIASITSGSKFPCPRFLRETLTSSGASTISVVTWAPFLASTIDEVKKWAYLMLVIGEDT